MVTRNVRAAGCGAALVLSLTATQSMGAILSFANRPAFNAAAVTINANENFSGFLVDTQFRTATVAANGFTLRQEGTDLAFRNLIDAVPVTFTDNNGTANASMFTNSAEGADPGTSVRLAFPIKAAAFGGDFYAVEGQPLAEGTIMDVVVNNAVAASFPIPTSAVGQFSFFGVVTTAGEQIDSVRLRSATLIAGGGGEGFGFDDAAVKFIPEPASLSALAALGLLAARRRTR